MGKQINFYMSEKKQESFIDFLRQNNFAFLDSSANEIEQISSTSSMTFYLYKADYGKIQTRNANPGSMDTIKSPVIQYSKTIIKTDQKKILRGRLWISDQYFDDEGNLTKKNDRFIKDYQKLVRWIKKVVPYQMIKKGEYLVREYVDDDIKEMQEKGFLLTI